MNKQNQYLFKDLDLDFCCETQDGMQQGTITISDSDTKLNLYSFDGQFFDNEQDIFKLKLHNAQYATLLECQLSGSGETSGSRSSIRNSEIVPNFVLLGWRPWDESDKVRSFSFTFVGARNAIHYGDFRQSEFKKLRPSDSDDGPWVDVDIIDYSKTKIIEFKTEGGIEISISMNISGTFGFASREFKCIPYVNVQAPHGLSVRQSMKLAADILNFFEMSLGHKTRLLDTRVFAATRQEISDKIAEDPNYSVPEFQLRSWHDDFSGLTITHPGDALFMFYNPEDRKIASSALNKWLDRREAWSNSYWLSRQYLKDNEVFDRPRMLKLMAWFESMPNHEFSSRVTDTLLSKLRRAVRGLPEFRETGLTAERLSSVLAELKRIPIKERLTSSIRDIKIYFANIVLPEELEEHAHSAVGIRNISAHGGEYAPLANSTDVVMCVWAIETICLLSSLVSIAPEEFLFERSFHPLKRYLVEARRVN